MDNSRSEIIGFSDNKADAVNIIDDIYQCKRQKAKKNALERN